MAGRGSRLRPHTLSTPKPLIPVAGQTIVSRLVKDIARIVNTPIDEVAFILGDPAFFGDDVVHSLQKLADDLGAKASIYRQDQPLGTGHAIMCAAESLDGPAVVAYADTLIEAEFNIDPAADSVIWVKKVERPEAFGVVKLNDRNEIIELVEKPTEFVSDLAVIGIYYFKDISILKKELQVVLDQHIVNGGEYQINDGIKRMMSNGLVFKPGEVDQWMDCGNREVTVETNRQVLENDLKKGIHNVHPSIQLFHSIVIPPCYIGEGVTLKNTVVGPHASIGSGCHIESSCISNSIVQEQTKISNAVISGSMIGSMVSYKGLAKDLSIGDYSEIHE